MARSAYGYAEARRHGGTAARRHGGVWSCTGRIACLQRVAELTVVEPPVVILVKLRELGTHVGRACGPLPLAQLTDQRVELVEIQHPVAISVEPPEYVRCM